MALYGLPALQLRLTGAAQSTLTAEGTLASGLKTTLDFTGDDMQANFDGSFQLADGLAAIKGKASVEAADIEPWLMTTGVNFPGIGLGMPVSLKADLDYGKKLLVVSSIQGEIADGPVSGDVNAELEDGLPHVSGDLAIDAFNLEPVAAMIVGDQALQPAATGWPSAPFQPEAALPLTADLDLSFGSVSAGLFGVIEDAHVQATVARDGIRLTDIQGKLDGGSLTGLLEARNNAGSALVSTQFKLAGADLGDLLQGSGLTGTGDVTATLSAAGKSVEALLASLSGSGTATVRDVKIPDLDPNAFAAILGQADQVGRDIDASRVAAFAPQLVAGGSFAAPPADIAFTVAAGVLRAPPVTFDAGKAMLSSDLKADFTTGKVAASGSITYAAGDEALVGSEPSVGFTVEGPLGALAGHYDMQPLAQFLTQRALEREQARVEALQASLIEKQRLRREVRYYASLQFERDRVAEAQRKAEEEARQAEERRQAEEAARRAAEAAAAEEAKRQADDAARAEQQRRAAEEAAKAQAEQDLRRREEEAKRKADEQAKTKADEAAQAAADDQTPTQSTSSKSGIEAAPLPPARPAKEQSSSKMFDPDAIGDFLKSLGN
jgi:hypothetical protein